MALPLLNLDDRRWTDLVDEGRALIPAYAPDWTDHNIHDPGITLMELFALVAEMDIYRANRIPAARRRKFLALVGVEPAPPVGARAALTFCLKCTALPTDLPATTEVVGTTPSGECIRFRTLDAITVVPGKLDAIQLQIGNDFTDLTAAALDRGESIAAFGVDPRPGSALYLGFCKALPPDRPVRLYFEVEDANDTERRRLLEQRTEARRACRPPDSVLRCDVEEPDSGFDTSDEGEQSAHGPRTTGRVGDPTYAATAGDEQSAREPLRHHSVRLVWDFYDGSGQWRGIDPEMVLDETRAFTLSGRVIVRLPSTLRAMRVGRVAEKRYYLRCRFMAGAYDAPPRLLAVFLNGVVAEQAVPVAPLTWTIAAGATIVGRPPTSGEATSFDVSFDDKGAITRLDFTASDAPQFWVREYTRATPATPTATERLTVEAVSLGLGSGKPNQEVAIPEVAVAGFSFQLFSWEHGWRRWTERPDFDASGRADSHFVLDAGEGRVIFGDGEHGRVVPPGFPIIASYLSTHCEAGNLAAHRIQKLADAPDPHIRANGTPTHNQALIQNFSDVAGRIECVTNPLPARGGSAGETLDRAAARAVDLVEATERAVTLDDVERLALKTPGVRLARAGAWANLHAAFPCMKAPGIVTLVVLPYLPADRPTPSRGLRRAVAAHLSSRRVLGTRVEVVGPTYVEVSVRAKVRARPGVSSDKLQQRIRDALNLFFHPLTGGPDGKGWPFGRDVYRSEVLQTIDETPGTDHVLELEFVADGRGPVCGNVCVPRIGLVAAGRHEIEVLRGEP